MCVYDVCPVVVELYTISSNPGHFVHSYSSHLGTCAELVCVDPVLLCDDNMSILKLLICCRISAIHCSCGDRIVLCGIR